MHRLRSRARLPQPRQVCEGDIKFAVAARIHQMKLQPKASRNSLELSHILVGARIDQHAKVARHWDQLPHQLQPLWRHLRAQVGHACDVAAGLAQAGDEATRHGVETHLEDDGDRGGGCRIAKGVFVLFVGASNNARFANGGWWNILPLPRARRARPSAKARTALAPAGWRSLQLRNPACQQLGPQRLFRYCTYVGFLHRLVPASHGRRADKFWSRTKVL
jgi:hypothetical protein